MVTRRTVPVQMDAATVALAELAAERDGVSTAEWIAKAARREVARTGVGPNYVELTEAEMIADDADQAAAEDIEAKRFRAAG